MQQEFDPEFKQLDGYTEINRNREVREATQQRVEPRAPHRLRLVKTRSYSSVWGIWTIFSHQLIK